MKETLERLYADPWIARLYTWGKLITVTGASQAVVQAVSFLCGIVVIRLLPTQEYALYVLANTMLGTMTVLSDSGISTGVTSRGGMVWKNPDLLGAVLVTGFRLRKMFAIGSLIVAIPLMTMLLLNHGAGLLTTVLIVIAIIPAFISSISGSLYQVAPRLHQDIFALQKNQITSNFIRLLASAVALMFFPFAFLTLFISGLSQAWSNANLKRISQRYADWSQKADVAIQFEILRFVKRLLPGSVYYCISGQLSLWLIAIFGSTSSIAEVGALARLVLVLSFFSVMMNVLVIPRFARLGENRRIILAYYTKIQLMMLVVSAALVFLAWLFSEEILLVLGDAYMHLNSELVLCVIGGSLNLIVGLSYVLNSCRGWLLHPVIGIGVGIAGIIAGLSLLDISTLRGVLLFNIFTGIVGLFVHPLYGFMKIQSLKK